MASGSWLSDTVWRRIERDFTLYGADDGEQRRGHRKLRDAGFLGNNLAANDDSLRYEKSLIDRWLRKGADGL